MHLLGHNHKSITHASTRDVSAYVVADCCNVNLFQSSTIIPFSLVMKLGPF